MAAYREATAEEASFCEAMVGEGNLIASGVPGIFGLGSAFLSVLEQVNRRLDGVAAADNAERMAFPPVIPRATLERHGYLASFPHLGMGLFGFEPDGDSAIPAGDKPCPCDSLDAQSSSLALTMNPAACYPVYPAIAGRSPLPPGGLLIDTGPSIVFRNEPSGDPARMQCFRQREMVRIGEPATVQQWRDIWRVRGLKLLRELGLDARDDVASDPFFGRAGRLLSKSQREQSLKFEILVPIASPEPTAVASFNYHQAHFTSLYAIRMADGGEAHTACLGFGLERLTLALFRRHGLTIDVWPAAIRDALC